MDEPGQQLGDGWETHRRDQRRRVALSTPLQRLRWLEDAIAFAHLTGALPRTTTPGSVQAQPPSRTSDRDDG